MKHVFNRKGSTLLMVLIMTAVLTVLGTALISMAFMNTNMKFNNDRAKKAVYFSESGIDQVYAFVGSKIELSLEDSRIKTNTFRGNLITYLEDSFKPSTDLLTGDLIPAPNPGQVQEDFFTELSYSEASDFLIKLGLKNAGVYEELYIKDTDKGIALEDKILDTEKLMAVLDAYYKEAFKVYFDSNFSDLDTDVDNGIPSLKGLNYNGNDCIITVNGGITNFSASGNDTFTIEGLHSQFNYEDRVTKAVTTNIVVTAPDKLYPFMTKEEVVSVENNPIWQNALVANKDIEFEGSTNKEVYIQGDVYAYGTDDNGITLSKAADVEVVGDMVTKKNIQTSYQNDALKVECGLLYCSSLITMPGAENSKIEIMNGNVYTKDDIELNAERSDISIKNGSYYGFSDGSYGALSHDNSSAIIINVPLARAGDPEDDNKAATLTIDGTKPDLNPITALSSYKTSMFTPKKSFEEPGVWIPGTAYADFIGDPEDPAKLPWPYQTGESVSIKGNYLAYTIPLSIPDEAPVDDKKYDDSKTIKSNASLPPYNEALALSIVTGTIVEETIDDETIETPIYFNSNDKIKYFKYVFEKYPDLFDLGDPTSLTINNYRYVLGNKVKSDGTLDSLYSFDDLNVFDSLKRQIRYDFFKYLLDTTNYINVSNPDKDPIYPPTDDESEPLYIEEPPQDYDVISAHIGYNQEVSDKLDDTDNKINAPFILDKPDVSGDEQATQIFYISNLDPTKSGYEEPNIRLVGRNPIGVASDTDITKHKDADEGYYQGIIVTRGDVLIDGDVNFAGTIIAGGTIKVVGGTGRSEIHNSEPETIEFLATNIRHNQSLRDLFKKGEKGKPIRFIRQDVVDNSDISNIKNTYKRLIDFKFWRLN